jgi:16S rRNA (guanine(966)-N(2))-methyltransferase RsmD
MRIIRGSHKGRRINPPKNLPVRPTTDLAKESLFNILEQQYYIEDTVVLDLFAGTGNISYEFASRGAERIISVDINETCVRFIKKVAEEYSFDRLQAVRAPALRYLKFTNLSFDIIFADPPYNLDRLDEIAEITFKRALLKPGGILIVEHSSSWNFSSHPAFREERKYGKVHFSFFTEEDSIEQK